MDLVATFIQNQGELMILLTGLMFALIIIVIILVTLARDRRLTAKELRHISEISHGLVRNQGDLSERIAAAQADLSGRLQQSQSGVSERLEKLTQRVGDGLQQQTEKTSQNLKQLGERLAVIDRAQQTITDLSQQMVSLQDILSNKQSRGAFGEIQLQDLVTTTLPPSAFKFQVTLGNSKRVDCLLTLPNPPGPVAIDSKFPLESFQALQGVENDAARHQAERAFRTDVITHVKDIAKKYIIPGETADSALMFLPSEAVYAELHANFRNVVEESFRHRVWIVSPTTLMATLNTVRAVLKDAKMREQADVIQTEIIKMLNDVGRLDKRVANLQGHFDLAVKDMREIRISTDKIIKKGDMIENLNFSDEPPEENLQPEPAHPQHFPGTENK